MADRRVRYILEVDYEGESVVVRAADDLREVDDAAREAGEGLRETGDGFSNLQANIVTAQAALGVAEQGFAALQSAAQFAWDTLSEGAALADARGDFADLAAEIGSTADVMENELLAAAGGLKTSAELIGESSTLMGLGLGLTKDEIVGLSRVAAELELDMGAMGDAINTGSTRALKEFGFNVGEVKARVAELREEGYSLNEAMALAMIEAGTAKIERVGAKSGEAAGQVQILEKVVEEVQNEFARGAAEGFASTLAEIANLGPGAAAGMGAMAYGAAEFTTSSIPKLMQWLPQVYNVIGAGWIPAFLEGGMAVGMLRAEVEASTTPLERYYEMQQSVQLITEGSTAATREYAQVQGEYAQVQGAEYAERQEWIARAAEWAADAQGRAASADYVRSRAVAEMNQEAADQEVTFELAGRAAEAWAEYVGELTARSGDYFAQITSSGRAQYDLNDAMYAAADAYGAGAVALGEIGVETGQFKQNVADAGVAATQSQVLVENLAGAARDGKIAWEGYTETVERALGVLNNNDYLIDLGPRKAPEMEDRGFREGYGEDFQPDTREISPYVVRLEAENQAVLDAVEEARGVVEGFVSPGEVYEAVMDLNIDAVQEKGKTVAAIIDGLPSRKTVKIDIEIENPALLEQLRAMGALPS